MHQCSPNWMVMARLCAITLMVRERIIRLCAFPALPPQEMSAYLAQALIAYGCWMMSVARSSPMPIQGVTAFRSTLMMLSARWVKIMAAFGSLRLLRKRSILTRLYGSDIPARDWSLPLQSPSIQPNHWPLHANRPHWL